MEKLLVIDKLIFSQNILIFLRVKYLRNLKEKTAVLPKSLGQVTEVKQIVSSRTKASAQRSVHIPGEEFGKIQTGYSKLKAKTQRLVILRDWATDFSPKWKCLDSAQKDLYTDTILGNYSTISLGHFIFSHIWSPHWSKGKSQGKL